MSAFWKQLTPYLIALSLAGNLFLARELYNRDRELNLVAWGNSVDKVWKYTHWASSDLLPRNDGRVVTPIPQGAVLAPQSLDALQSLPHYGRRVGGDDLRTVQQFLRYAQRAYEEAAKEQGESGQVSPESVQRLTKVSEGLVLMARHQARTNELKQSRNPWNHAAWREVWHSIATGLRAIEFVPLPE